ncbi:MAG: PQQ-binding-like beta-propeller repeat protein [Planctomycetes bacterium]|nr:PQQ-binding-like beta-propeller repeat protein [Planctomycetota bacterium]
MYDRRIALSARVGMKRIGWLVILLGLGSSVAAGPGRKIITATGRDRGVLVVVGSGGADVAIDLVKNGRFISRVLGLKGEAVGAAREKIRKAGVYGERLAVMEGSAKRLPFGDGVVDLLVLTDGSAGPGVDEIARVLGLDSVAYVQNAGKLKSKLLSDRRFKTKVSGDALIAFKQAPKGIDDWTHIRHGADNNPRSVDQLAGPPYQTQWLAGPLKSRSHYLGHALVCNGRFFYTDYMQTTARGYRDKTQTIQHQMIFAFDADNGFPLWEKHVPVPPGFREAPRNMGWLAAEGDRLFNIGAGEGCQVIEAATGKVLRTIGRGKWRWVALAEGKLLGIVDGSLRAFNPKNGRKLWAVPVKGRLNWGSPVALGGRVLLHYTDQGGRAQAIDLASGKVLWEKKHPELVFNYGDAAGWKDLYVLSGWDVHKKVGKALALRSKDGTIAWKLDQTLGSTGFVLGDTICGGIYEKNRKGRYPDFVMVDTATGKIKDRIGNRPMMRCVRLTGLRDWLCTSGGLVMLNYKTKEQYWYPDFRSSCVAGAIHGNGYTYILPNECFCSHTVAGLVALSPIGKKRASSRRGKVRSFVKGPGAVGGRSDGDWPTYRHDAGRSGMSEKAIPTPKKICWKATVGGAPTAPIVADGLVFVANDQHELKAYEAKSGRLKWRFTAGGAITKAPTFASGAVFFGAADGWVYAVQAESGKLAWRRRIVPDADYILAYGRLRSRAPINTNVFVDKGIAWVCAGGVSYDGIVLAGLDVKSGKVVAKNDELGLDVEEITQTGDTGKKQDRPMGLAPRGAIVATDRYLIVPNGYGQPLAIERDNSLRRIRLGSGQAQGNRLSLAGDYLFVGMPPVGDSVSTMWGRGGGYSVYSMSRYGREVSGREAKGVKVEAHTYSDPHPQYFYRVPFAHGGPLVTRGEDVIGAAWRASGTDIARVSIGGSDLRKLVYDVKWVTRIPMIARAAVRAGDSYYAVGEGQDSDGKCNGKGLFVALDANDGKVAGRLPLKGRPRADGFAAGEGKLFVVTEEGLLLALDSY